MRAVIQRVRSAHVSVSNHEISRIGHGILVYLSIARDDTEHSAHSIAQDILNAPAFPDTRGKLAQSIQDTGGEALIVSQFTLHTRFTNNGKRPDFSKAAQPGRAEHLYKLVLQYVAKGAITVAQGQFGAHMEIQSTNIGPVTFLLERDE